MKMAKILDACCGGRMFWFDKAHPDAVYMDNRRLDTITSNGQHFVVSRIYWGISGICLLRITRSAWLFLIRHI